MGLIQAGLTSAGSILADQWKEYFYCEALPADVIAVRGQKRVSKGSSNRHGSDNIISSGSIIAVADGQCMLIVEQGKVVEVCAEPGEFVFDASTEPTIFSGSLGQSIIATFKNLGKRFTFGGEAPKDQRVYYFNTKELTGNKYGTPSPVPFRVVDQRAGIDIDIRVKCFGEYSYRVMDPLLFYTNVCGNVEAAYTRENLDSQLKTELLTALQPAFARISDQGIRYSSLPGHTTELAAALNQELSDKWINLRGIEIVSFGVSSVKALDEDEEMLRNMQRDATYTNANLRDAMLASSTGQAMRDAANNANGAMAGFMGMNMAGQFGMNTMNNYQQAQYQQPPYQQPPYQQPPYQQPPYQQAPPQYQQQIPPQTQQPIPMQPPQQQAQEATGAAAGAPVVGWTCGKCGTVNQGKFCANCGEKKPEGAPQYKCDKCGWVPPDPSNPPKFCPECGDPFGDEDKV